VFAKEDGVKLPMTTMNTGNEQPPPKTNGASSVVQELFQQQQQTTSDGRERDVDGKEEGHDCSGGTQERTLWMVLVLSERCLMQ
jgi:hypothetical protein